MRKFYSAYDACEYAAKITKEWESETGEHMSVDKLLGIASVSDEHGTFDEGDESYYVVDDNGSVGVTNDGEKMIMWFAKAKSPNTYTNNTSQNKSIFCSECGARISGNASFCPECGKPVVKPVMSNPAPQNNQNVQSAPQSNQSAPQQQRTWSATISTSNVEHSHTSVRPHGNVGYSDVINSPDFIKAVKKNKKGKKGCAIVMFIVPLIATPVYSHFSDELDFAHGLLLGFAISVAILLISFLASLKERFEKSFDGVVEDRYEKRVRTREDRESNNECWETHYFTIIRKDNGGKHKIEEDNALSYSYFREGDKVRYHGKMGLLYPYEKYDKSNDEYVICAFCRRQVPIADDTCPKCKMPILK